MNPRETQPLDAMYQPDSPYTTVIAEWNGDLLAFRHWARTFGQKRWPGFVSPKNGQTDPRLAWLLGLAVLAMVIPAALVTPNQADWFARALTCVPVQALVFGALGLTLGLEARTEHWQRSISRNLWRALGCVFAVLCLLALITLSNSFSNSGLDARVWDGLGPDMLKASGAGLLLPMAVLLPMAPMAIWCLHKRLWWLPLLVATTLFILNLLASNGLRLEDWTGSAWFLSVQKFLHFPVPLIQVMVQTSVWQLLFFWMLVLGHHRSDVQSFWSKLRATGWLLELLAMMAGTLLLSARWQGRLPNPELQTFGFATANLMMLTLEASALYLLCSWFWQPLRVLSGWLLESLGQHVLVVLPLGLALLGLFSNMPLISARTASDLRVAELGPVSLLPLLVVGLVWALLRLFLWLCGLMAQPNQSDQCWTDPRYRRLKGLHSISTSGQVGLVKMRPAMEPRVKISQRRSVKSNFHTHD